MWSLMLILSKIFLETMQITFNKHTFNDHAEQIQHKAWEHINKPVCQFSAPCDHNDADYCVVMENQ